MKKKRKRRSSATRKAYSVFRNAYTRFPKKPTTFPKKSTRFSECLPGFPNAYLVSRQENETEIFEFFRMLKGEIANTKDNTIICLRVDLATFFKTYINLIHIVGKLATYTCTIETADLCEEFERIVCTKRVYVQLN